MKTEKFFYDADRYQFDFNICSYKKGFFQLDTGQDAAYFGQWVNPAALKIVCYCEGDVSIITTESIHEFIEEIEKIKIWNEEQGHKFYGIDPGLNEENEKKMKSIGLGEHLH